MKFLKLFGLVCAATLAFSGCGKKGGASAAAEPMDVAGVKVDFPKMKDAFQGAPPELNGLVNDAMSGVRYGLYDKTLMALDKLANTPTLTDPQKQAVNTVIEEMKQVVAKAGATK
jgi:hypothetical protein